MPADPYGEQLPEEEDEEDEEYGDKDADLEEQEAALEDGAEAGAGGRKRGRASGESGGGPQSRKRAKLDGMEALDADEVAALREDAIEQFGRDVLADEGKSVHTRAAERAGVEAAWEEMRAADDAALQPRHSVLLGEAPAARHAALAAAVAVACRGTLAAGGQPPRGPAQGGVETFGRPARRAWGAVLEPSPSRDADAAVARLARGVALGRDKAPATAPIEGLLRAIITAGGQGEQTAAGAGGPRPKADALPPAVAAALAAVCGRAMALAGGSRVAVTSTVKFAGQSMQVTQMVTAGTEAAAKATADAAAALTRTSMAGGAGTLSLDAVVTNLDKPEAINTLAKTGLDWEAYKAKSGLDEGFEARAREAGFVERQAFLGRVDGRTEEAARSVRARERASAAVQQ